MTVLRSGSSRLPLAPLAALFLLAILAMTWVASSHVCARPLAVGDALATFGLHLSALPFAAPVSAVQVCPAVLGLIALSTALSAGVLITACRDRHRALTLAVLMRTLARLPVLRTFAALTLAGGAVIAAMVAVDDDGSADLSLCLTLAVILAGVSLASIVCALVGSRLVLALCARLLLALAMPIDEQSAGTYAREPRAPRRDARIFPTSFGRGLRAPPLPVR